MCEHRMYSLCRRGPNMNEWSHNLWREVRLSQRVTHCSQFTLTDAGQQYRSSALSGNHGNV